MRGGSYREAIFFSVDHAEEVYEESKSRHSVWDCKLIEVMRKKDSTVVSPIYEWSEQDVWNYIHEMGLKVNPLYERGYSRIGCVGCPMGSYKQKLKEFEDYPEIKRAYIRAFQKMLDVRKENGKAQRIDDWENGEGVFNWWIEQKKFSEIKGQNTLGNMIDT